MQSYILPLTQNQIMALRRDKIGEGVIVVRKDYPSPKEYPARMYIYERQTEDSKRLSRFFEGFDDDFNPMYYYSYAGMVVGEVELVGIEVYRSYDPACGVSRRDYPKYLNQKDGLVHGLILKNAKFYNRALPLSKFVLASTNGPLPKIFGSDNEVEIK